MKTPQQNIVCLMLLAVLTCGSGCAALAKAGLGLVSDATDLPPRPSEDMSAYVTKGELLETLNAFGAWLLENGYLYDPELDAEATQEH